MHSTGHNLYFSRQELLIEKNLTELFFISKTMKGVEPAENQISLRVCWTTPFHWTRSNTLGTISKFS